MTLREFFLSPRLYSQALREHRQAILDQRAAGAAFDEVQQRYRHGGATYSDLALAFQVESRAIEATWDPFRRVLRYTVAAPLACAVYAAPWVPAAYYGWRCFHHA